MPKVALLAEGVDRNSSVMVSVFSMCSSPSSRRAWIEIAIFIQTRPSRWVALLAEGVDRNHRRMEAKQFLDVALLAEGVDRNNLKERGIAMSKVALLAEGVDRNAFTLLLGPDLQGRPPRGGRG